VTARATPPNAHAEAGASRPVPDWQRAVEALAFALGGSDVARHGPAGLDPGAVAALRRLDPRAPSRPDFWRAMERVVRPVCAVPDRAEEEERWALLIHAMALMAPLVHRRAQPPGFETSPGAVLAEEDYSELRLERLLRSRGPALVQEVAALAQFLHQRGRAIDWVRFAPLILAAPESEKAEEARRAVARAYYRRQTS
jgi:CRISPR type I-E-associated protein CasB/Cse2